MVMPYFPDHPCRHPGCPRLVPKGKKYCDEHVSLHPEEVRSAAERGYGSRWRRLSKAFLRAHPLCVECEREGRYVKAKEKSTEKIDGAIATIMGLDRAIRCGNDTKESVYDTRGLLFV